MLKIIPFFFLISSLTLQAQQKNLDAVTIQLVREGVALAAQTTQTISCDFTQQKEMSMLKDQIISRGKFFFKKEQSLRWEYTYPFSYLIVIHNDEVTIRSDDNVTKFSAQTNKVFTEINRIILGSIRGTILNDSSFSTSFYPANTGYLVKLVPLSPGLRENLTKIMIFFNRTDFTVDKLELYEQAGDYTIIDFSEKKINAPLPDQTFLLD